ncbi:MAG TPA: polysaccharide deacetylase family protein, partial [Candidatus Methanoperedens sp.]|nr:polysaccharide deacetylase family protein [Candidatus Methanoperedens sp.]
MNAISVDVEDYFHVNAFKTVVGRENWDSYPRRVPDSTRKVLDLLDEHDTRATFFVLGWVAERHPELVREIARRGHEIGCHGYGHELLFD